MLENGPILSHEVFETPTFPLYREMLSHDGDLASWFGGLKKLVDAENLISAEPELVPYLDVVNRDTIDEIPSTRDFVVVKPSSTETVSQVVRFAARNKVAIVPRGASTGREGGTLPVRRSILLDFGLMSRVIDIDAENGLVTAEPGITLEALEARLNERGLSIGQGPGHASLGGSISTNSLGQRSSHFGDMRNVVADMEIVVKDGCVMHTGRAVWRNNAGYDLNQLFIGSEGTLGALTSVTLKASPKPELTLKRMYSFRESFKAAVGVAKDIERSYFPASNRVDDELRNQGKYSAVRVMFEGNKDAVELQASLCDEFVESSGGEVLPDSVAAVILKRRVAAAFAKGVRPTTTRVVAEEVGLKFTYWISCLARWKELCSRFGIEYGGCQLNMSYPGVVTFYSEYPLGGNGKAREYSRMTQEFYAFVIASGGSFSPTHGVGTRLRRYMHMQYSSGHVDLLLSVKKAFDPFNIFNPGKVIKLTDVGRPRR